MATDPNLAPETLLRDIFGYIDRAEEMLTARDALALATLHETVDTLCAQVAALTPEEMARYAAEVAHAMERLNRLGEKMSHLQGEVIGHLQSLNQGRKATRAYISAPEV